ncbi:MAG: radical SAM family heme chaperone HemW [Firmicutes bacterium]|nr:radical SAM family heme chaperone HemW [Bacillota bacterium]
MIINNTKKALGIYIHIPFCVRKCIYCDFSSYTDWNKSIEEQYFRALYREAELLADMIGEMSEVYAGSAIFPDTVFIGGGTPSAVDENYIAGLLNIIPAAEGAEITIEANPGTLTEKKLHLYRECGINRISIGVQSFNDSELSFLGRIHNGREAEAAVNMARNAGFDNINIDLIFGFPGHDMKSWQETLRKAVNLKPQHISFYSLQIEEGTRLYKMFRKEEIEQISDELNREMYHYAADFLSSAGLNRYEISNASLPKKECRHNLKYWDMSQYIGIGAGAHSFFREDRFFNPSGINDYIDFTDLNFYGINSNFFTGRKFFKNSFEDNVTDYIFTGMRRINGISIEDFNSRFAADFDEIYSRRIKKYMEDGFLEKSGGFLRFTEKGLDITNYILADMI